MQKKKFTPDIRHQVKLLTKSDNWSNFFYLIGDYLIISISIAFAQSNESIFWYLISIMVIGSRMRALENLAHEASHKSLFANKFINKWIGIIFCAFPICRSLAIYTKFHVKQHHRYLGDPEKDPDRVRFRKMGMDNLPIPRAKLILHLASIFCLLQTPEHLIKTAKVLFQYSSDMPLDEQIAYFCFRILVTALIIWLGIWREFLLFWLIPFIVTYKIIRYLAVLSEHGGLYNSQTEIGLSRNNFCHPLLRFFLYPHGDYFHIIHHLFPLVPHYNLGRVHRILIKEQEYKNAHHCYGYFISLAPDRKTTFEEMIF